MISWASHWSSGHGLLSFSGGASEPVGGHHRFRWYLLLKQIRVPSFEGQLGGQGGPVGWTCGVDLWNVPGISELHELDCKKIEYHKALDRISYRFLIYFCYSISSFIVSEKNIIRICWRKKYPVDRTQILWQLNIQAFWSLTLGVKLDWHSTIRRIRRKSSFVSSQGLSG